MATIDGIRRSTMAASILQCFCCQWWRNRWARDSEGSQRKEQDDSSGGRSPSKSKKAGRLHGDKRSKEEDQVGDLSVVQRETEILRSYQKPPPPKNRARASRVPRALKAVDSKISSDIFKALAETEPEANGPQQISDSSASEAAVKPPEDSSQDVRSSVHSNKDNSPAVDKEDRPHPESSSSEDFNKEPSSERVDHAETDDGASEEKPSCDEKDEGTKSPSQEDLVEVHSEEPTPSADNEEPSDPQDKDGSEPTQIEDTPPELVTEAEDTDSSKVQRKDSVSSSESDDNGSVQAADSPEEDSDKDSERENAVVSIVASEENEDLSDSDENKKRVLVRSASNPTQPSAPMVSTSRKKERLVPSVHGEQMNQLLNSLKTHLKQDDNSSADCQATKLSPEEDLASTGDDT